MSDIPSGPTPPPPPPSGLTPPPGMVGYQSTPWGSVPLQRVSTLAKALVITVIVAAVGQLVSLVLLPSQLSDARDFVAGRIDEDAFNSSQVLPGLVQAVIGLSVLATAVLTFIWLFRVAQNHRAIGRRTTFHPVFAIVGWFLPPLFYVLPALVLRENWKAAEPTASPGDDGWRRSGEPWLVWLWFLLYSVAPFVVILAGDGPNLANGLGQKPVDIAQNLVDQETGAYLTGGLSVLAAIAWVLVVRGLTARHVRVTGEQA